MRKLYEVMSAEGLLGKVYPLDWSLFVLFFVIVFYFTIVIPTHQCLLRDIGVYWLRSWFLSGYFSIPLVEAFLFLLHMLSYFIGDLLQVIACIVSL